MEVNGITGSLVRRTVRKNDWFHQVLREESIRAPQDEEERLNTVLICTETDRNSRI
jgi:hypothetical protein